MSQRVVHKFPLDHGATHLWVGSHPRVLHVGIDPSGRRSPHVAVWIEVDTPDPGDEQMMVRASFDLYGTGHPLEAGPHEHVGSVVDHMRSLVWHVYERPAEPPPSPIFPPGFPARLGGPMQEPAAPVAALATGGFIKPGQAYLVNEGDCDGLTLPATAIASAGPKPGLPPPAAEAPEGRPSMIWDGGRRASPRAPGWPLRHFRQQLNNRGRPA